MRKSWTLGGLGAAIGLVLSTTAYAVPARAQDVLGADAAACAPSASGSAVLARVHGFKSRTGKLRVQTYGNDPERFLDKGSKLRRIEVPVTPAGDMHVCIEVPGPGTYGVAVRHDRDGNGKSGWSDGGGFSRNPKLRLPNPKPDFDDVAIDVGPGVKRIDIVLNYKNGLFSIGPVAEAR